MGYTRDMYDFTRKTYKVLFNRHLINLLRVHRINTVLDVGASRGQFGSLLRKLGFKGTILSFEPLADTFNLLEKRSRHDANWHAYNFALGDAQGSLALNVLHGRGLSSFLEPNAYCRNFLQKKSSIDESLSVSVKTLDSVFADLPCDDTSRIHLKMDTQGYDLKVFAGARETLQAIQTMQAELSIHALYEGMPNYLTALAAYAEAGFSPSGWFPILRDQDSLIECDVLMTRNP